MRTPGKALARLTLAAFIAAGMNSAATAQAPKDVVLLRALPADAISIDTYRKKPVYDVGNQRIGEIVDLLVDREGLLRAAIVSVGGFLGLASKYVAVPFSGLQLREVERKRRVVVDTTRQELTKAPAFVYDRKSQSWVREHPD
jgi:hypothetical protein